jgi:hypothetical protein
MSVHEIKRISLMDVPGKLRELADRCERDHRHTVVVLIGHDNGSVDIRGYGDRTSALETIGWLHRGLDVMTSGSSSEHYQDEPPGA